MKLPNLIRIIRWLYSTDQKLTWSKVKNWVNSYRRINRVESQPHETQNSIYWEQEQFDYRVDQVAKLSPGCLNGACIHCGCDTPEKFWEDDACEQGCYGKWMSEDEWNGFRKQKLNAKR